MIPVGGMHIKTKIVLIVLSITILTLSLSTCTFIYNDFKFFREDMKRNLTVLASAVGFNSRASLVFLDAEAAGKILLSLKDETQIQSAALYDSNNNLFVRYTQDDSSQFKAPTSLNEGQIFYKNHVEIVHPIFLEGKRVGKIYINAHLKELNDRLIKYLYIVGLILLVTLTIALFLAIKLQAIISNPILSLANTAKEIYQTSDYSIRVKHESLDELGTLFSGFNEMLSQIEKRDDELKKNEESMRTILDNAFDAIITMDEDGLITTWNQRAVKIFGWHADEVVGKRLVDIIIPSQYRKDHIKGLERFLDTGIGKILNQQIQMAALRQDGTEFPVELAISAIKSEESYIFTGIIRDITERKRAEKNLLNTREQLRNLSNRLQSAREEERTRIAREIHDELGQTLTALKFDLTWINKNLFQPDAAVVEKIISMTDQIENTVQMVQRIASELRPQILDILGLCEALKWLSKEFQKRTGIQCELTIHPNHIDLDQERATAFFRIYQEALTNVARHANAGLVQSSFEKQDKQLVLKVKDNGKGMDISKAEDPESFGLIGIRERILVFGGETSIQSNRGEGTLITISIPTNNP